MLTVFRRGELIIKARAINGRNRWVPKAVENVPIVQVNELSSSLKDLLPNTLLASAFVTYLSGCSDSVRAEKIEKWKFELNSNAFLFSTFVESERQLLQWNTEGLPSDETSHQNAIILKQVNYTVIINTFRDSAVPFLR